MDLNSYSKGLAGSYNWWNNFVSQQSHKIVVAAFRNSRFVFRSETGKLSLICVKFFIEFLSILWQRPVNAVFITLRVLEINLGIALLQAAQHLFRRFHPANKLDILNSAKLVLVPQAQLPENW